MLLVLIFLASTTVIGLAWCARLSELRTWSERAALGLTVALVLQLWLPFLTSKFLGVGIARGPAIAWGILFFAALWIVVRAVRLKGAIPTTNALRSALGVRLGHRDFRESALFFLALGGCMGWLFYTHSLRPTAEGLTSAGVSWEDQAGHATYASSFLYSDNLTTLEYPHFSGWPLAYPFLCNSLAAALAQLGASLSQAFWLSGWYAVMTFLLVAWVVLRDWTGSARRASVGIGLFLGAGGFGFIDFWRGVAGGTPWTEMLMQHDYANAWELTLHFHNVLTAVLLPMRSFLFGLPVAFAALFLIWRTLETAPANARRELLTAGSLTGLLPLINAHAFIVVAWCGLGLLAIFLRSIDRKILVGAAGWYLVPALLLGLPQLGWMRHQLIVTNQFVRLAPGWLTEGKNEWEWMAYWVHNAGVWLPLGVVGWWAAPMRVRKLTAPFLALFLVGNVVAFQPLVYDNIKLFVFGNLAVAAVTVLLFARLRRYSLLLLGLMGPLTGLILASGILSIWRELKLEWVIVDAEGVRFAEVVKANSPPRAVFLTGSELTHPVSVLTGRAQVLGYQGWVINLGIPYGDRIADVRQMFEGGARASGLFDRYHVKFVVIGPPERREFPQLNEALIAARAVRHWTSGRYTLYEF